MSVSVTLVGSMDGTCMCFWSSMSPWQSLGHGLGESVPGSCPAELPAGLLDSLTGGR